jgi:polyhydroxyalkanoate synthase subunit PhaC
MFKSYEETFSNLLTRIASTDAQVKACESNVIDDEGVFRLHKYCPITERKYRTPVLIVCAFINRPYVLDMHPEISVVLKYLRAGFEVYMIDWGYPGPAERFLNLDDYAGFLERCVRRVVRDSGTGNVNLHGYCLGGTICAAYTTLDQRRIKNLVLQTTPVEFHTDNLIARWARAVDPDKIVDAFGMAPGSLMNFAFLLVDPLNLAFGKYSSLLNQLDSDEEMASFLRMENWVFDSPAIPAETFRQYIREWYHDNSLIKGDFRLLGQRVDLGRISIPILVLAARYDHIVPPEAQKAVLNVVASEDKEVFEVEKGHVGITTSRGSHREYWPKAVGWLETRSEHVARTPARAPDRSSL